MATLTLSAGGAAPLGKVTVVPFPRENLSVRATAVRLHQTNGMDYLFYTGARLRTRHLIHLTPACANVTLSCQAAVKDSNDLWSEWASVKTSTFANYTPNAGGASVSIGSGSAQDALLEEPAIRFPRLGQGSSRLGMFRTLVNEGFADEQRRQVWPVMRAAFHCVFTDLDEDEAAMLHRFYQSLNGPLTPFWFDWVDPDSGEETRYLVRFRDPTLVDELFTLDRSAMEFHLVELIGTGDPGAE